MKKENNQEQLLTKEEKIQSESGQTLKEDFEVDLFDLEIANVAFTTSEARPIP